VDARQLERIPVEVHWVVVIGEVLEGEPIPSPYVQASWGAAIGFAIDRPLLDTVCARRDPITGRPGSARSIKIPSRPMTQLRLRGELQSAKVGNTSE
jgi:hypothetical protein